MCLAVISMTTTSPPCAGSHMSVQGDAEEREGPAHTGDRRGEVIDHSGARTSARARTATKEDESHIGHIQFATAFGARVSSSRNDRTAARCWNPMANHTHRARKIWWRSTRCQDDERSLRLFRACCCSKGVAAKGKGTHLAVRSPALCGLRRVEQPEASRTCMR